MELTLLGWTPYYERHFQAIAGPESRVGRVSAEHKHLYRVFTEAGEVLAQVSGKYRYDAVGRSDYPVVGDWVLLSPGGLDDRASILAALPRVNRFSRMNAGDREEEQVLAANLDHVFLFSALNQEYNLRRIERYLVMAWENGAAPVIVLNKTDLCEDVPARVHEVTGIAPGVPVHAVSCLTGAGLDRLMPYLAPGQTVALLGSSGTGKSTFLNRMLGEAVQRTGEIRQDDGRGRHTTTFRQMHLLPGGGLVIDTPGLRELKLWASETGITGTFAEIEAFASHCRFGNCQHDGEPGCAVQAALDAGEIDLARFQSYVKLQKELAYLSRRDNLNEAQDEKAKWKQISKEIKRINKR